MKGYNPFTPPRTGLNTYLRVQIIYASDCLPDVTTLQCFPNIHTALDAVQIHRRSKSGFTTELLSCRLETFDDKVIHHEAVQVTVSEDIVSSTLKSQ